MGEKVTKVKDIYEACAGTFDTGSLFWNFFDNCHPSPLRACRPMQVEGQVNLRDAARRDISYVNPATGKQYGLAEGTKLAVLLVRPRGWHLDEAHVTVDGRWV